MSQELHKERKPMQLDSFALKFVIYAAPVIAIVFSVASQIEAGHDAMQEARFEGSSLMGGVEAPPPFIGGWFTVYGDLGDPNMKCYGVERGEDPVRSILEVMAQEFGQYDWLLADYVMIMPNGDQVPLERKQLIEEAQPGGVYCATRVK